MIAAIYQHKASAVITALLLVATVVMGMIMLYASSQFSILNTQKVMTAEESFALLSGVELWAKEAIKAYARLPQNQKASFTWPLEMIPINSGKISVTAVLSDLQGRIDLNQVTPEEPIFLRLLRLIDPSIKKETALLLARNLAAWREARYDPNNILNKYYQSLPEPYQEPHLPLSHPSELKLIQGFSPKLYAALSPYVLTMRTDNAGKININTASLPVLMSLSDEITEDLAKQLIMARTEQKGFQTIEDFLNQLNLLQQSGSKINTLSPNQAQKIDKSKITTTSDYFVLDSYIVRKDFSLHVRTSYYLLSSSADQVFLQWQTIIPS